MNEKERKNMNAVTKRMREERLSGRLAGDPDVLAELKRALERALEVKGSPARVSFGGPSMPLWEYYDREAMRLLTERR